MKNNNFEVTPQLIPDILLIKPKLYFDKRGHFAESFNYKKYRAFLEKKNNFVQDNLSVSKKNVLRGLHYQIPPFSQSKLVQVIEGKVLDVCVDIRKKSKTFGKYCSIILSGKTLEQLYIPKGFAHGFLVLSKTAIFSYKVDNFYSPKHDRGINYNDTKIGIDWLKNKKNFLISKKDKSLPYLVDVKDFF
mgnify:CR=1 FL=1|tara:strand:+ start:413 stop:979 length:567 start_codon:yes stop_codon:yes gene_type:complete